MDKNTIQQNNVTKLKKNKIRDEKLRIFDTKQYANRKKIEQLSQASFSLTREIDSYKVTKINRGYPGNYYKKIDRLAKKYSILSNQIKLLRLKLLLSVYKRRNQHLDKKINALNSVSIF